MRSLQVLVADDDDDYREALTLTLLDAGFEVRSVSSGPAALKHLASEISPDVILLHWRMPGMNGMEVLRELRALGISKPVIRGKLREIHPAFNQIQNYPKFGYCWLSE